MTTISAGTSKQGFNLDPGGIFGAGASVFGSIMNKKSQDATNAMQMQLAREQMGFQERMSNTAHQREVQDLIAAGLNPILSATGGAGASSPQGTMAQLGAPQISDASIAALANTPMRAKELREKEKQIGNIIENTKNTAQNTETSKSQEQMNKASAYKASKEAEYIDFQKKLVPLQMMSIENEIINRNKSTNADVALKLLDSKVRNLDFERHKELRGVRKSAPSWLKNYILNPAAVAGEDIGRFVKAR